MSKPPDAIDEQMLALLHANARLPLVTLAKKVGLSRSATQDRLNRLLGNGVITGFTIRRARADGQSQQAWLMLRYLPGSTCEVMVPRLRKIAGVQACYSLAGNIDLLLRVRTSDQAGLMRAREQIAKLEGVAEVQTAPLMKTHFE